MVLTQQFDVNGNRTQLATTLGSVPDFVNNYSYDGYLQLTAVAQSGQASGHTVAEKRVGLTYDADGRWSTITRYADLGATDLVATSTYEFDLAGRLTELTHTQGATTLAGYTWTYNTAGRLTQQVSTLDGTADYTYDATGQLSAAD